MFGLKRWMVAGVLAMTPMGAVGLVAGTPAEAAAVMDDGDEEMAQSFVSFTIKDGKHEITHPGFDAVHGEETIMEVREGKAKYVVTLEVSREGEGDYHLVVTFTKNGGKLMDHEKVTAHPRQKVELAHGKLSLMVDPTGDVDDSRKDKIDPIGGDDPLG